MTQHVLPRRLTGAGLVAMMITSVLGGGSASAAGAKPATHTGWLDGAEYRVEVPAHWNGTLLLYSHGYFPPGVNPPGVLLTNRAETEGWLLEHGYALAASDFTGVSGAVYEVALHDQIALLDWFDANVGRPKHTIAFGSSSGGQISVQLAERNPRRIDGVLSMCAPFDIAGAWNSMLDVSFALRTLLAPNAGIDLVRYTPDSATHSAGALAGAVNAAVDDVRGRARLALAAAVGNVPDWIDAAAPRPDTVEAAVRAQAAWISGVHLGAFGPFSRLDLESHAGGNPSWNTNVDYAR